MRRHGQRSISINLLPTDPEAARRKFIGLGFILLLLLMMGGMGLNYQWTCRQQTALREEQARLQQHLAGLQGNLPAAVTGEGQAKQLAALRQKVEALEKRQAIAIHLLDEVEAGMVTGTRLESVKIEGSHLQLTGTAGTHSQVAGGIANLTAGSHFSQVSALDVYFDENSTLRFILQLEPGGADI